MDEWKIQVASVYWTFPFFLDNPTEQTLSDDQMP